MSTPTQTAAAAGELKSRLNGRAVAPDDPNFDQARLGWNLAADQRPAAVVLAESADDVVAAVGVAGENGLRVAPQSTGHNAALSGELESTILVKLTKLNSVAIEDNRARVGPAALWMDLQSAAAEHGLAGLSGSAGDVAVAGYSLGGGIGWLGRKHGLATNKIKAAEVVLADGRAIKTDAENEPDLFWALRGGGGSFGVVTELEMELVPLHQLYAGVLFWPQERAPEVLKAWSEWVHDLPDEMTSVGRLMNVPPLPMIPPEVRGQSFVVVEAAYLGDEQSGAELLKPLRDLDPGMDTFNMIPPPGLVALHMDPPEPVPGAGHGKLLGSCPAEAMDAIVEAAGPQTNTPLLSVEVRHLDGAFARRDPDGGALDHIDAPFAMYTVGMAPDPQAKAAIEADVDKVHEALKPWDSGAYMNFAERPTDPSTMFSPDAYARLREVKGRYDPDERIQSSQPIPRA